MEFSELLQKQIDKLDLKVWTPWRETEKSNIDMAFGFVLKGKPIELYVISVAIDELWAPYIYIINHYLRTHIIGKIFILKLKCG